MIDVEDRRRLRWHQRPQHRLPLDEWEPTQIPAVQPQQVERIVVLRRSAAHQLTRRIGGMLWDKGPKAQTDQRGLVSVLRLFLVYQ
jgi:hypothetical protein